MPTGIKVHGTDVFHRVARQLKEAGRGDLAKDMTKAMRRAAEPVKNQMQSEVRGLRTRSGRGGASGRAARSAHALRNRKRLTENAKQKAHRNSGLRDTVARATRTQASASGGRAAVRIAAKQSLMPADQRKLPQHMNKGSWRHPVFGGDRWVTQTTTPAGWFDRPARRGGPRVRDEAVAVVIRTINKLGQG